MISEVYLLFIYLLLLFYHILHHASRACPPLCKNLLCVFDVYRLMYILVYSYLLRYLSMTGKDLHKLSADEI